MVGAPCLLGSWVTEINCGCSSIIIIPIGTTKMNRYEIAIGKVSSSETILLEGLESPLVMDFSSENGYYREKIAAALGIPKHVWELPFQYGQTYV